MKIEATEPIGIWPKGKVVNVSDTVAAQLIDAGKAKPAGSKKKKTTRKKGTS